MDHAFPPDGSRTNLIEKDQTDPRWLSFKKPGQSNRSLSARYRTNSLLEATPIFRRRRVLWVLTVLGDTE